MATRNVKPLVKDYKAALVFLAKRENIEVKYTKSGALSVESVGYLKGFVGCSIMCSVQELLERWVDQAGYKISATNLALYFRNERDMIKSEGQRLVVCIEFHDTFLNTISDSVVEECEEENDDDEENEDSDELETYEDVNIENPPEDDNWEPTISQEEADQALEFWRKSGMF